MKQTDRIVDYIDRFGSISSLEAIRDLGITRLSARIWDLRHKGFEIDEEWDKAPNRFGETVRFIRYSFREAE